MRSRKAGCNPNVDAKLARPLLSVVTLCCACAGSAHPDKGQDPSKFAPPPDNGPTPPGWATYTRVPGSPPPPPGPPIECGRCEGRFAVVVEGGFTVFLAMNVEGEIIHPFVRCTGDCDTMCCPFPLTDDLAVTGRLLANVNSWYVVDPAMCRLTETGEVSKEGGQK
jgi:hypothetical protein